MPSLDRAVLYVNAVVIVLVLLTGVITTLSSSAFNFVFKRIGGAIYGAVTESSQAGRRQVELKAQTAAALTQALTDLSDRMAQDLRGDKALARIRTLCPEARKACDALLAAYDDGVTRDRNGFYPLLDAIRDAAGACLNI